LRVTVYGLVGVVGVGPFVRAAEEEFAAAAGEGAAEIGE
jgi:hypothetical protein